MRSGRNRADAPAILCTGIIALDEVFQAFPGAVARLVTFDALSISLIDMERREYELIDLVTGAVPPPSSESRRSLDDTLLAEVAATRAPARIDDVQRDVVPRATRERMRARGHHSAAPIFERGARIFVCTTGVGTPDSFRIVTAASPIGSEVSSSARS